MKKGEQVMPKISVIIPVYKAEKYLRKCVESIMYGEEQDLEVILVEDCSPDGSWQLCQQLAEEFAQVKCLRNDRNSGVSYTRNRGLDTASGQYVLFVDSDDWVSCRYAKTLIEAQEANPGKLVVCSYTFIDYVSQSRCIRDLPEVSVLQRRDFLRLSDGVLLQQLWNKIFSLELIRKTGIRFDETICMGEDYQFVMDVLEAAECQECVLLHQPLYYYIRRNEGSLMSNWASVENFQRAIGWLERMSGICGISKTDVHCASQLKELYRYSIAVSPKLSGREKRQAIREVMGSEWNAGDCILQYKYRLREALNRLKSSVCYFSGCVQGKLQKWKNNLKACSYRKLFRDGSLTVISQNCIGGVFSHDMHLPFQSPTVNLCIPAADYVKFVNNLEHYLQMELELHWGEEYPVGRLDDVEILFVHYDTCLEASEAWERRKKRVNLRNVLVLSTDRDGFDETVFEQWKTITYPKLLFTARKEFAADPDSLFFPEYEGAGCVLDLISKRKFYKGNRLIRKGQQAMIPRQ
jgi:uncharacterized protein (DUF1919 family)/glycosyltransferase involved in cell wall biosynthesis